MKTITFLLIALTCMAAQCEGDFGELGCIEIGGGSTETPIETEPVDPYMVKGSPNTCYDFPFMACKEECLADESVNTCRDFCCAASATNVANECHAIVPFTIPEVEECTREIERGLCGNGCLATCRSCVDKCADYYSYCSGMAEGQLGWGWRD